MLISFKNWKIWLNDLPWSLKWFVILMLIRPIVDNFYYLKEISPLFSPLYIVGVATPLLALYTIFKLPKPNYSRLDTYMGVFSVLITISCLALLISDAFSLNAIEFTLKFSFPFIMYFFCRRLIRSKNDLHGIFQTFIYSTFFVITIFCYELIFDPINIQISRGLERFQGSYADVMNYAIYMTGGILVVCYSFINKSIVGHETGFKRFLPLLIALFLGILLLFNIHHTASYVVFIALLILFLLHTLKANFGYGLLFVVAISGLIYMNGTASFDEKIKPLIQTDISVYEGEKDNEQLLHGRMGRWMRFYDHFNSQNSFVQLFGLPLGMDNPYIYIGKGSHNDFVRTTMFNGYLGLIIYILIILNLLSRITGYLLPMRFLGFGALSIILLFSISTTPLLYAPLMYLLLPVFAMLALPKQVMD
ncbi:MAG: hypothetical protein M3Q95_09620 [Bacteroidota bacterium]|nr:hypothetical protein [Bacteroidota bacterium]